MTTADLMTLAERALRAEKDRRGWKPPWHEHFKLVHNGVDHAWIPAKPPFYAVNCDPAECAAPGCPRTESGFPE